MNLEMLAEGAGVLGIKLSPCKLEQFRRYAELLVEWNTRMNLTRIPPDEFVSLHFLDSLTLNKAIDLHAVTKMIDVGSGAGFPGLPIKIAYPSISVVLLDSTRKRLDFLDAVVADIGLKNVATIHGRAEETCRQPEHRQAYDLAVARAVAPMEKLAGWLLPFVRQNGVAIAMKSAGAEEEIEQAANGIRNSNGKLESIVTAAIPGAAIERRLAVMRKLSNPAHPSTKPR